jgi:hypothetical protein
MIWLSVFWCRWFIPQVFFRGSQKLVGFFQSHYYFLPLFNPLVQFLLQSGLLYDMGTRLSPIPPAAAATSTSNSATGSIATPVPTISSTCCGDIHLNELLYVRKLLID